MQNPENNTSEYINYLYQECIRKAVTPPSNLFEQITLFINTPEGQRGLKQFKEIPPDKVGIHKFVPTNPFKKAFQQ